jgi:hypothetical protein
MSWRKDLYLILFIYPNNTYMLNGDRHVRPHAFSPIFALHAMYSETSIYHSRMYHFPRSIIQFPWSQNRSYFYKPPFLLFYHIHHSFFRTPNENDELRFRCIFALSVISYNLFRCLFCLPFIINYKLN